MFWYRIELALGRNSIVGTTVRQADIPKNLLADEHHQRRDGQKTNVATTVELRTLEPRNDPRKRWLTESDRTP